MLCGGRRGRGDYFFATWPAGASFFCWPGGGEFGPYLHLTLNQKTSGLTLVEALTATDLGRGGDHPEVGFLTVNDLLHEWIHHDANHLRQMLANIQAYTWPSMGNAQRFSAPDASPDGSG